MSGSFTVYIAGSFRHMHGVRLLGSALAACGCQMLDWTAKASPPPGLTAAQRRIWMDTDQAGGQVYGFCRNACFNADLVIYYGESGQDAGVEVGLASASGTPVLGLSGPLESPGLMLHGAVNAWAASAQEIINIVSELARLKAGAIAIADLVTPAAIILAPLLLERCLDNGQKAY